MKYVYSIRSRNGYIYNYFNTIIAARNFIAASFFNPDLIICKEKLIINNNESLIKDND